MKINSRNISKVLILVLAISFLSACTHKNVQPVDNGLLLQNVGFVGAKTSKDGKNFVEIDTKADKLELEILDQTIYDSIQEKDFYIFAYNEDKVLKALNKSPHLEELIQKTEIPDEEPEGIIISPVDKLPVEDLTILDEYEFDFNGDNIMEKVNMYTTAEKAPNGEIMWDDGQRWLLVVHGQDKDYVLFDDYVQLGNITNYIYTIEEDFYIATITSGTANLTLKSYMYSSENDTFIENIKFNTKGNVNMLHSSGGL